MPGVKGRSGRKRNPRNAQRYFNEQFDLNMFDLTDKVIELAKEGNREMLIYCFDRRLGKPKATTEIEGGEALAAGAVLKILQIVAEHKRKQLSSQEQKALQGQPYGNLASRLQDVQKKDC